jgi:repressor LexA
MNNSQLSPNEQKALQVIKKYYNEHSKTPSVRGLMQLLGYKSPRSAALLLTNLVSKKFLNKSPSGKLRLNLEQDLDYQKSQATTTLPLVGSVACGQPLLAEENIEALIPVTTKLARPPFSYFLLKARGDSMDLRDINDGDLLLIRKQSTAISGEIVVALINDEATIKEFYQQDSYIVLRPRSSNPLHQPVILTSDFEIQGVLVSILPSFITV